MSKILDDVKTGLKGIRGAGDAIRGSVMEATDEAFDNNRNHPQTQATQAKNRALTEKGKQDVQGVDNMLAQHEWDRKAQQQPAACGTSAPPPSSTGPGMQRSV
ncbi:hypothetical protein F4779DRAFT_616255 [Xylariaceae sp. FL0662B]|nr:hypothetical protein F4779DRAFT_616255 [Xylariaceae sp. FL0662B]